MIYDKTARKKAINLSSSSEKNLEEIVRDEKNKRWQEENKDFIDEYNARIAKNGIFSDGVKNF
jgi:antitoxin CcdA